MSEHVRPRGVQVYPMPEKVCGPFDRYALVLRDNGNGLEARMVHTEGVAYLVTAEKDWCWNDYSTTERHWTLEELVAESVEVIRLRVQAGRDEAVDLADWVREFGHRLESNFVAVYQWANA